jgi:undecaprenyl-diphosphatase
MRPSRIFEVDTRLSTQLCHADRPGLPRTLAAILTHTADGIYLLALLGLIYALGESDWSRRALLMGAADLSTFLIVQAIKVAVRRRRPPGEWGRASRRIDPYSFPSGHAARGGALALVGVALGPLWLALLLALWGPLVAFTRVVLGVHYLSDAVLGFVLGASVAGIVLSLA